MATVEDCFAGETILITGGTGFVGKTLIEKLLRSCPDLDKIYIIVRQKRGLTVSQRRESLLKSPLFDTVRKDYPTFENKIEAIFGDLLEPSLGLNKDDTTKLCSQVSFVFHSAATVKFNEPLKVATQMNVRSTCDLITLLKQMKKLKAFVHVSTAYAHVDKEIIEEQLYEGFIPPHLLLDLTSSLTDGKLESLTDALLKPAPNTYVFTKAAAERLIQEEAGELPVVIVRPPIIIGTWLEPFPGWNDSLNGASGVLLAGITGACQAMVAKPDVVFDVVPVDIVVNSLILAARKQALKRSTEPFVVNMSSRTNPVLVFDVAGYSYRYMFKYHFETFYKECNHCYTTVQNRIVWQIWKFFELNVYAKLLNLVVSLYLRRENSTLT